MIRAAMFNKTPTVPEQRHWREIGDEHRDAREWHAACESYATHLTENPDDFAIYVQLGNCAKEAGDFALSEKSYNKAIEIDARDADVRVQLGHLLKVEKRYDEALASYNAASIIDPEHRDATHEKIEIIARRNRNEHMAGNERTIPVMRFDDLTQLVQHLKKDKAKADLFRSYFLGFIPQ